MLRILSLPFLFVWITSSLFAQQSVSSKDILQKMNTAIDQIKTLQYSMKGWEKKESGGDQYSEIDVKLNRTPQKIYLKNHAEPNPDAEILYVAGERSNKALVNPSKWLPTLSLDPYGGQLRKNQHNTILSTGFDVLNRIIRAAVARAEKEATPEEKSRIYTDVFVYSGDVTWNGRNCYKITINDPTFKWVSYTVKEGDKLSKFCAERNISEYLIVERNANVSDFWDFDPGKTVMIPTSYAKSTVLYIDKQTYMPILQIMSDDKGQFEKYEFYNVKINPPFANDEFSEDFSGYNF